MKLKKNLQSFRKLNKIQSQVYFMYGGYMTEITRLYHKLTIERCQMYVAQLCAAIHLGELEHPTEQEKEALRALVFHLNQDLQVLERLSGDEA